MSHPMPLAARSARAFALASFVALVGGCGAGGGAGGAGGGGGGGGGGDTFVAEQQHNLDAINAYRGQVGSPPLVLDAQLTSFATAGSEELQTDHTPHKHFQDAGMALFTTYGFRSFAGENQGDAFGWPPAGSVNAQIDEILAAMWAEGPGAGAAHGHYENMANPAFTRLGVGLVVDGGGGLYFTNDFSE